ncbi:leucine rich repeat-containing protein [Cystoisospora suis]|uniref:Leucine rich repeat-containing protein n=1 Tax=Cystoisospora suis TaxID=483139 RepID=A0A2C6KM68_9APIC|nr:leucine rich repeat-containing protein [Cystoisospora suis]
MTKALLRQICRECGQYESPALNEKLYLHFRGFSKIENLEEYKNVKALWLEGNGIRRIEGLGSLVALKCLFLQQNSVSEIQNLDCCPNLVTLDLSHNCLRRVSGLGSLKQLSSIKLAYNAFQSLRRRGKFVLPTAVSPSSDVEATFAFSETLPELRSGDLIDRKRSGELADKKCYTRGRPESSPHCRQDLEGLLECQSLSNIDLSHNYIDEEPHTTIDEKDPSSLENKSAADKAPENAAGEGPPKAKPDDWMEGFLSLLQQLPNLACLYFHGNPVVRKVPHYRKRVVASLPRLRYLDDRPVKPVEREGSEAWVRGGREAESTAIRRFREAEQRKSEVELREFREMQQKYRERVKKALERIEREDEERRCALPGEGRSAAGNTAWSEEDQHREISRADRVRRRWLAAADSQLDSAGVPAADQAADHRNRGVHGTRADAHGPARDSGLIQDDSWPRAPTVSPFQRDSSVTTHVLTDEEGGTSPSDLARLTSSESLEGSDDEQQTSKTTNDVCPESGRCSPTILEGEQPVEPVLSPSSPVRQYQDAGGHAPPAVSQGTPAAAQGAAGPTWDRKHLPSTLLLDQLD